MKPVAMCCAVAALLMGCGDAAQERMTEGQSSPEQADAVYGETSTQFECRPGDDDPSSHPAFSPLAVTRLAFHCLQFANAEGFSTGKEDYFVIDIEPGNGDGGTSGGMLRIPLHEIKTKAFLDGRSIAIVSNGKRFGALERECAAIREVGVQDVVALLDTRDMAEEGVAISVREFVAERPYGIWRIENRTTEPDLKSPVLVNKAGVEPVLVDQQQRDGSNALVRTLVVVDPENEKTWNISGNVRVAGYVFVLEGGLQGLRQFEAQAIAMARAQARPRIGERGCRS